MPSNRAEIYLEDEGDSVAAMFRFVGGPFNPDSRAHQLANILRKYAESITTASRQETEVEPAANESRVVTLNG